MSMTDVLKLAQVLDNVRVRLPDGSLLKPTTVETGPCHPNLVIVDVEPCDEGEACQTEGVQVESLDESRVAA